MKTTIFPLLMSCVVVLVAVLLSLSMTTAAQDGNAVEKKNEIESMFDGKYVSVYIKDSRKHSGQILTDAKLVEVGGKTMLIGWGADTERDANWTAGVRVGIAWESVNRFYVLTDEQFEDLKSTF